MGPSLVRRRASQRLKVDTGDPGTLVSVNPVSDGVNVPASLRPGTRASAPGPGHPAPALLPANDVALKQSH